jgi:predicted RNA methylase
MGEQMAVASFEELVGEKKTKVLSFEELAAPEPTERKVPSFDELTRMGLPERAFKGYLNKTILEATEKARPSAGVVEAVTWATSEPMQKVMEELPKDATLWEQIKVMPRLWWAITKGYYAPRQKARQAQTLEGLKDLRPAATFEVPEAKTTAEKATEVGTGLGAFLTQLFVAKKLIPAGTVLPDHVAWEIVNQATGGTPGQGAMTRGALGATGAIPTTTLAGKVGKTAAESGLFAGLTAVGGGDVEDIIVSAMVPIAFNGWNFARQRTHLTRYEKQLRQQALKAHEQRVKAGMSQSVSYLHYNADMRTVDTAVAKAKQKIYRDDAFAPAREKWEAERLKALKLIAKGGKENKARGNAILDFIERGPGAPLREQPRQFPTAERKPGGLTRADEFRMRQVAGQIERGRQRSAIAEQRQRYDDAMRRVFTKRIPAREPVEAAPPAPAPRVSAMEQARQRAGQALEARKAEVAAARPEASVIAQKYSQMENLLDALETEQIQDRREALLNEAERIDRDITDLSKLQGKNFTQLHRIARRLGVKIPKGASKTAIIKLLVGKADLSQVQKTPTGYRVEAPLPGARAGQTANVYDFDSFAEAADFLEQGQPPEAPAEDTFIAKLEKDLAILKGQTPSRFDWKAAKVGDMTPFGEKILARRIKKKKQAQKMADEQGGRVIIDGKRTWAVVEPAAPEARAEPTPPAEKKGSTGAYARKILRALDDLVQKEAAAEPEAPAKRELRPITDIPATITTGWRGVTLDGPTLVSDNKILFYKAALPDKAIASLKKKKGYGKTFKEDEIKGLVDKYVAEAQTEAEVLGYSMETTDYSGDRPIAVLQAGDEQIRVDAHQLRYAMRPTNADTIKAATRQSPIVLYRDDQPVAVLITEDFEPAKYRGKPAEKKAPAKVRAKPPESKEIALEPPITKAEKQVLEAVGAGKPSTAEQKLLKSVVAHLESGRGLASQQFFAMADQAYGGTRAQGKYGASDAYDVLELAINQYIKDHGEGLAPTQDYGAAVEVAKWLDDELLAKIPTQTTRTGEKQRMQQFSTPPHYSFALAWVANIGENDIVLEPSAGTGSLLVHALNAEPAKVYANELSERRANLLRQLGPDEVFQEDAEQIHNILPEDMRPTVVLMNPPFSTAAHRMGEKKVYGMDLKHIEAALNYLQDGSRLVAIMGRPRVEGTESATFNRWIDQIGKKYNVRANVHVGRGVYKKYGTSFPTRLLVIDKTGPTKEKIVGGPVDSIPDLMYAIEGVRNDRVKAKPEPVGEAGQEVTRPTQAGVQPAQPLQPPTAELGARGARARRPVGEVPRPVSRPGEAHVPLEAAERPERAPKRPRPRPEGAEKPHEVRTPTVREPRGQPESVLKPVSVQQQRRQKDKLSENIFEPYAPSKFYLAGAKKHPAALVESMAMAAVSAPDVHYELSLPASLVKEGRLSAIQLEVIAYAGQAHSEFLPTTSEGIQYRKGFFIGDGTGVGKGREISGIILDNWNKGRKKALWISVSKDLLQDAKRDWGKGGIGQNEQLIFPFKGGMKLKANKGIMYVTYDTLKWTNKKGVKEGEKIKANINDIVNWLGEDFDGVIAFDESHKMGNAMRMKVERGVKQPSKRALIGLELQRRLPKARIVYVSATGATEVVNLTYAQRLGLWGSETPFANPLDFVSEMASGGIANMELIARDLKALGLYQARSIAYNDGTEEGTVRFDTIEHKLTADQQAIYNKLAEGWQIVLQNFQKALEVTNGNKDWRAKAAAASAFYGTQQRFFNQVLTAMQVPSVIGKIAQNLQDRQSIVIQLTNTMEAAQERALADLDKDQDLQDFDITPRDALIQLIQHCFPVAQFETYIDENGNETARPVVDSKGNPIQNREAVRMRETLIEEIGSIRVPESPLDMIINHFGPDNVAEVTGRKRRVVSKRQPDGSQKKVIEKRSHARNMADVSAFMSGKKRILIFSEAGGTGASYHADRTRQNQQKRIHYVLQPGWRADTCLQGMGRTHRSNQAFAPEYWLVRTDLNAQKRFTSSVARRLDQMGALTRGERKAGSAGLFTAADNLESQEARDALRVFFRDLVNEDVQGLDTKTFEAQTGLKLTDDQGNLLRDNLPTIRQFLNRLLAMKIDDQNRVFNAFEERLIDRVHQAITAGTLDRGVEVYRADKVEKISDQAVYTHPQTGSETRYVKLKAYIKTKAVRWTNIQQRKPEKFVRSIRGKHLYAALPAKARTDPETGRIIDQYRLVSPSGTHRFVEQTAIDWDHRKQWEEIKGDDAKAAWQEAIERMPEYNTKDEHFLTGIILPIWDKIRGKAKIYRILTTDGEEMIGRTMHPNYVSKTLTALGADVERPQITPEQARERLLSTDIELELANEWKLRYSRVSGEDRIELQGPNFQHNAELEAMGVFRETIHYHTRYFVPTADASVIEKVLKRWPAVEIRHLRTEDPGTQLESPMGGFVGGRPAKVQVSAITKEKMSTGSEAMDRFLLRTKGYGASKRPGTLRRIWSAGAGFLHEFHYLPDLPKTEAFGMVREQFRHTEEIAKGAIEWSTNRMKWALAPTEGVNREIRKRLQAIEMKIIADGEAEDIARGGVELPPGVTEADVMIAQRRAQQLYDKYPSVRKAYDRIREVGQEVADMLVEEGQLTRERAREFYYPHRVIRYLKDEDALMGIPGRRPADYKKGYLKRRRGGYDYSTDVLDRLAEHWAQVRRDVQYTRFLRKVLAEEQRNWFRKEYPEWTEFVLDEETGRRVRNPIPAGYKEVVVLPGRYYYSTHGVTQDMAWALAEQNLEVISEMLDDKTASKVRKVLAVGRKRSFIVREEIARQIHNMPTMAISRNPAYLFVKGFNTFVKGQILFNPLYTLPFHLTNFTGDAHKVFVALPSALRGKYLTNYWREVIKAHRGLKGERFQQAQDMGVIGSGWIGVDLPELHTMLPEIAKAEITGAGKTFVHSVKKVWNLSRRVGAGREDWLRYALFDRLMDLQEKGKDLRRYGVKDRRVVAGITDPVALAAKVARDIAGDYTAIGRSGRILSDLAVPFYRWMHLNLPWWPRIMKEYAAKGQVGRIIYALLAAAAPYILANLWNYSDEDRRKFERSLPPWMRWNFHIVSLHGKKMYYVPLPLDDVLDFIGAPETILDIQRFQRGMITGSELIKRIAINSTYESGMSIVNAIGGLAGVIQSAIGLQTFPDIKPYLETRPRMKAVNIAGDIFGAPGQLGKNLLREGVTVDNKTGDIKLGPKTTDVLNRAWMGIRPYSVDIGRTTELYHKSVYKQSRFFFDKKSGKYVKQIAGQPHKRKKRKVDSLLIQLGGRPRRAKAKLTGIPSREQIVEDLPTLEELLAEK